VPTARSRTITLLRLRPSRQPTNVDFPAYTKVLDGYSSLWQADSQAVTGGLYRAPEPVHRNLSDLRLLAIPPLRISNCRKRFVLRKHLFRGTVQQAP